MRAVEALDLRRQGYSFREIGAKLGCCHATAYRHVTEALADTVRERDQLAADLIQIEVERLDAALNAVWDGAMKGDVRKVDRVLKISERRSRLLGLDAPTKLEAS